MLTLEAPPRQEICPGASGCKNARSSQASVRLTRWFAVAISPMLHSRDCQTEWALLRLSRLLALVLRITLFRSLPMPGPPTPDAAECSPRAG
jgi:hypothetical protein